MCGITGIVVRGRAVNLPNYIRGMTEQLRHRGPDAGDVWCDVAAGVALGHRRLAIIDPAPTGHQPMRSVGGRYVIVFNGEIYNHLELRKGMPEVGWRGHSDTETLLAGFEAWGIDETLARAVGMFAFALWDVVERCMILARDRLGEKPLYYGWHGEAFLFGSELKALAAYPGWHGEVDRDSLLQYLRYGYVPSPRSIWRGIRKLLPGTYLRLPADISAEELPLPIYYWRARQVAAATEITELDANVATNALEERLRGVIAGQMVADVPLGAFLSGGVDSSTVVALMQVISPRPVKTFSIGFAESGYDEAGHARAVAAHLGTDHTEFYVGPADALAVVPHLPAMFDEPFADSSQIPTYLVAQLARRYVTVSLSGDGGDELFGGYNRYHWGRRVWRWAAPVPPILRRSLGRLILGISPSIWDRFGDRLPRRLRQPTLGDRLHKLANVLDVVDPDDLYRRLVSLDSNPGMVIRSGVDEPTWADAEAAAFGASARGEDSTDQMMFHDLVGYLTDDILVKVDRATMAASLETRVPLLDHRLVEYAWSLPMGLKIRGGEGKWLLRQVLYRHVPRTLIERPKQGFGVPLDAWLRGPLREWAESLLAESRLRQDGLLNPEQVRVKWLEHLSGRRNWQHWLWSILMFQAWREQWR